MAVSLKTKILIWGQAGAHCSYPGCHRNLVMDATGTDDESLVGDIAHIVAESPDGPRGVSELSAQQRDHPSNLLLLCKVHHKLVDDQPSTYTVERLHSYKREQEERVKSAMSADAAGALHANEIYASFIDEWASMVEIDRWKIWSSHMLGADGPAMSVETAEMLYSAAEWIFSRIWPRRVPTLESAFQAFMRVASDLLTTFHAHSEKRNGWYYTERFYKISEWNPELYHRLADKYEDHVRLVEDLVLEITRAANLICDEVRTHLDPSFRMREGALVVVSGPYSDLRFHTHRVEYTADERTERPYPGLEAFRKLRLTRDFSFGRRSEEDDR